MTTDAPRLRLAKHIDLSKADPNCSNCTRGVVRYEQMHEDGQDLSVPVICKCVSRNKGVQADQFDRLLHDLQEQLASGMFAENLANDVSCLPRESRVRAISNLETQAGREDVPEHIRRQVQTALKLIHQRKLPVSAAGN